MSIVFFYIWAVISKIHHIFEIVLSSETPFFFTVDWISWFLVSESKKDWNMSCNLPKWQSPTSASKNIIMVTILSGFNLREDKANHFGYITKPVAMYFALPVAEQQQQESTTTFLFWHTVLMSYSCPTPGFCIGVWKTFQQSFRGLYQY